ncbi:MAG: hypothetical protein FJY75_05310 [Candidatus Eisenbacteria bacterium]|uniref:Uncharacterized protein n=1 Tax=Eiseniibacteriota bacterium TaxID=2212470 RepID=A0A938BQI2_UNCEI|nr:hypothetical protein [Candidatus Eisenbacteria bacterium]
MTQRHEGGPQQMARILGILGDLLRETSELVRQEPSSGSGRTTGEQAASLPGAGPGGPGREQPAEPGGPGSTGSSPSPPDPDGIAAREELLMVCESPPGPVAFPWSWVAAADLAEDGALLGVRIVDRQARSELSLGRVLGLWTWNELARRGESVQRFFRPEELIARFPAGQSVQMPAAAPPVGRPPVPPSGLPSPSPEAAPAPPAAAAAPGAPPPPGAEAAPPEPEEIEAVAPRPPAVALPFPVKRRAPVHAGEPPVAAPVRAPGAGPEPVPDQSPAPPPAAPAVPDQVGIISPSALARRFLMRHLCELGYEVLEARDLDDPLLPADLKGVAALFLDESLQDDWASRPAATGGIPLVLLTVGGELSVPPAGEPSPAKAVLPRPFERAEVERVVRWLRAPGAGAADEGSGDHGHSRNDTWLFADPFGPAAEREHSRR